MESIENKELVQDMVRQLKAEMKVREVKFMYQKKDGSIRDTKGTLNSEIYGKENEPIWSSKTIPENQIRYYDTNSKDWRSFFSENLISFS